MEWVGFFAMIWVAIIMLLCGFGMWIAGRLSEQGKMTYYVVGGAMLVIGLVCANAAYWHAPFVIVTK